MPDGESSWMCELQLQTSLLQGSLSLPGAVTWSAVFTEGAGFDWSTWGGSIRKGDVRSPYFPHEPNNRAKVIIKTFFTDRTGDLKCWINKAAVKARRDFCSWMKKNMEQKWNIDQFIKNKVVVLLNGSCKNI